MIRLGLPIAPIDNGDDNVVKNAFSGGGRAHKYWRRVRVVSKGHLTWRYYYNTPEDRARYLEDRKKKRHRGKHEELFHLSDEQVAEMLHIGRDEWHAHFAEFKAPRIPLSDLTADTLYAPTGLMTPKITLDAGAQALCDELAEAEEPEDLWCEAIHPMRALDAAVKLLPEEIRNRHGDAVREVRFFGTKKAARKATTGKVPRGAAAWAHGASGRLTLPAEGCNFGKKLDWLANRTDMYGGNYPISIILHEMAHCFAYQMKKPMFKQAHPGAPNWDNWIALANKKFRGRGKERGITKYAEKNFEERFCESFAAALTDPKGLANACPEAYTFMHQMMPSAVPPLDEMRRLSLSLDDYEAFVNPWHVEGPPDLTIAQQIAADIPEPARAKAFYRVDPANPDKVGKQGNADRFYEMNFRGRTVFFRYGMRDADDVDDNGESKAVWRPGSVEAYGDATKPAIQQIKEAYDEQGNPLNPTYAYLHLVQDVLPDDQVLSVYGKTKVTMGYILNNGGLSSDDPAIKALFDPSKGKAVFQKVLVSFGAQKRTDRARELAALHAELDKLKEGTPAHSKLSAEIEKKLLRMENEDQGGLKPRAAGTSYLPVPDTMTPVEVSATHFKQKSGCFNYDNWNIEGSEYITRINQVAPGSLEEMRILDEMREKFPGMLALKGRRWPKGATQTDPVTGKKIKVGGRFRKGAPYLKKDRRTGMRVPVLRKKTYTMQNPDGTVTRVETLRGSDGRFRITNRMWAGLLTPNGEEVKSAAHLERLSRVAAKNRHRTWISVKTDRKRLRRRGRIVVDKKGAVERTRHMEVEFDGSGPPKLIGRKWKADLSSDNPRVDQLLKDDPLSESVEWAKDRKILPADQIMLHEVPVKTGPPQEQGDRVVLTTTTLDWRGKTDRGGRKVVARLVRYIPGKAAGEPPPAPGWDRMPEGIPLLEREVPPGLPGQLSPKMKRLISEGLLPDWYEHTPVQREWYMTHFTPAYADWEKTFEAKKLESYDPVYVFAGEINMGGGSNIFRRVGDKAVMDSIEWAYEPPAPLPLRDEALAYLHKYVDPRTGETMSTEQRLLLPLDGSVRVDEIAHIPGVKVHKTKAGAVSHITMSLEQEGFPAVRSILESMSLTGDIVQLLEERAAMLLAAEQQRLKEAHELELEQIDPTWQIENWGTRLNRTLPNGRKFVTADHQKRGIQKLFDNDLRCLLAHFMGTGKTVSALVAAKMAMARPMRKGMEPGEKIPDDLVGADRAKWLADHPFIPGTLDPRNPSRVLVVAPLNTVEQWRQSAADFNEGAMVVGSGSNDMPIDEFVKGVKDGSINTDLVVVGPQYFTIHAEKLKACGFDGLVIDEVHQGIKNETANRNKIVNDWNEDMRMLLLLTGTPMTTSPADFVEYVRLLSKGKQWGGMDKKTFTSEYLTKSAIPEQLGVSGVGSPRIAVKDSKLDEFSAIIGQWMDIALPKHVKGKVLPAVRIEDQQTAQMTGSQMAAYNLYMAALGQYGAPGGLSDEEAAKAGPNAKRQAMNAKGVMNCIGYKPGGDDTFSTVVTDTVDKEGNIVPTKRVFRAPDPRVLFSKKQRGRNAGKWPSIAELEGGTQGAAILTQHASHIFGGLTYDEVAGRPIGYGMPVPGLEDPFRPQPTAEQVKEAKKRMKAAGWEGGSAKFENADSGHIGLQFRGDSIPWDQALQNRIDAARKRGDKKQAAALSAQLRGRGEKLAEAQEFQRAYRHALSFGIEGILPQREIRDYSPDEILSMTASSWEISDAEAESLLAMPPSPSETRDTLTTSKTGGYGSVTVTMNDTFVSDTTGSLHLLHRPEDVDASGKARSKRTPFSEIAANSIVAVDPKALAKAGIKKPSIPTGLSKEEREEIKQELESWAPPPFRLALDEPRDAKDRVAVRRTDTNELVYVPEKSVSEVVKSLMDPGMRMERVKADIMSTHGNAKADAVRAHIERFHDGSGPGPDGERQMVMFAGDILTGCRVMESVVRLMGYRDINETMPGSPHYDPTDPTTKDGTSPNGKYFVTYIGSTYTGDREQNVLIFKKVKDALGRDSKTSLFVDMCENPRAAATVRVGEGPEVEVDWMSYRGDVSNDHLPEGVEGIQMSQFSAEQRKTAQVTLGISPPESYVSRMNGKTLEKAYFYGASLAQHKVDRYDPQSKKTKRVSIAQDLLERFSSRDEKGNWRDKLSTSADILTMIARTPDPSKTKNPKVAAAQRERIAALKAAYSEVAAANATMDPPLTEGQIAAMNNCEMIICSDAAQVGMNLPNASEMIMYDSLGSPMAEWQRMTRCARLLPEAVTKELLGKPIMEDSGRKRKNPETGKIEPIMVQARDDNGKFLYETEGKGRGIFDEIRDMEGDLFATEDRSMVQASVTGLKLSGFTMAGEHRTTAQKTLPATDALAQIATQANLEATSARNRKQAQAWENIANQALTARNQGGRAARAQLLAFKDTKSPGSNTPVISFPATGLPEYDPTAGTYAKVDTKSPEKAIRDAINRLDDKQRAVIMNAGFVKAEPPHEGSPDAAAVYLAIRAQEILTWVDTMRPIVAQEMREAVGGARVTDEEVMNRLIDTMNPTDRAILKEKKYLVNVFKVKASGAVGQIEKHTQVLEHEIVDDAGKTKKIKERVKTKVFTGYEQEYPVKTEVRTSVLGRARTESNEQIMDKVQSGVRYKADTHFEYISSSDLGAVSMRKALRIVLDLSRLGDNRIVAFDPLSLLKGGGEGSRGGNVVGHTSSGKPIYASKVGVHPHWRRSAISAKTEKGHEHLAPHVVKHGGKTYVKAGHNSDTGSVSYHEHDAERHVIDSNSGRSFANHREDHPYARGGLFVVHGQPKGRGGDLPEVINDPAHGKLSIRSHNSDTGKTHYHKQALNAGWGKAVVAGLPLGVLDG